MVMCKMANQRILVIDDNVAFHQLLRDMLNDRGGLGADALQGALLTDPSESKAGEGDLFEIESAFQGDEGLRMALKAEHEERPYAVAFVDVRMPGMDGVETTRKLWQIGPETQVVICTAYSEYTWEQLSQSLNRPDQFFILKKPFEQIEVRQLANALIRKWNLLHEASQRQKQLEQMLEVRNQRLRQTLEQSQNLSEEIERTSDRLIQEQRVRKQAEEQLRQTQVLRKSGRQAEALPAGFEGLLAEMLRVNRRLLQLPDLAAEERQALERIRMLAEGLERT